MNDALQFWRRVGAHITVTTVDGKTHSGLIWPGTDDSVLLLLTGGPEPYKINTDDIASYRNNT